MENSKILIYDGSFNGFLSTVFRVFDEKIQVADIQKNSRAQRGLFSDTETVFTQMEHAKCVWNGVQRKSHIAIRNIYFAFLSETKGIELLLYQYIRKLFSPADKLSLNFGEESVLKIGQLAKAVAKEKKHMEAFVRFQSSQDGIQFADITPDFDVLPLISRHYRFHYAQQPWILYDSKRNYGLYYNLKSVELISLDSEALFGRKGLSEINMKSLIIRKLHTQPVRKSRNTYIQEREAV